jgi:hypothetical protein
MLSGFAAAIAAMAASAGSKKGSGAEAPVPTRSASRLIGAALGSFVGEVGIQAPFSVMPATATPFVLQVLPAGQKR